jgi:hypothetical protein
MQTLYKALEQLLFLATPASIQAQVDNSANMNKALLTTGPLLCSFVVFKKHCLHNKG